MSKVVQFPARERGDAFTVTKLKWIEVVTLDRAISAEAARLATVLAVKFLSRRSGCAFPSQKTLADILGITDRQVRRHMTAMVDAGYIVQRNRGNNRVNEYRIAFPTGHHASAGTKRDRTSEGTRTGRGASGPGPDIGRPPNPMREPYEEPYEGRPMAAEPYDRRSTLDDSRGSPLDEAPPIPSDEPESEPSRVGDLVDVDGDMHELEYRQEDGRWRARSLATGEFRSIGFGSGGEVLAYEPDEIPF